MVCEGKIEGAYKFGVSWAAHDRLPRPEDKRLKNGDVLDIGRENGRIRFLVLRF